jgi:LacI family transcriptional regulator
MRRRIATTLQDVAREVGVSTMTVSVVLNGARSATRVSSDTRARIVDAATRLHYRPNAAARGLQRRRMNTIGIISRVDSGEVNFYFVEVLHGILEIATAYNQNVTVFAVRDWETNTERIRQFCDGRVDGFILLDPILPKLFVDDLSHITPFVALHSDEHLENIWNIAVDNFSGAYQAVQHLIGKGHRRILHLTGPLSLSEPKERLAGYQRALEEAGIPFDPSLVVTCNFSRNSGLREMRQLLQERRLQPFPTACFCASDAIAIGCIEALQEAHLRVPEDVSIVGFDDSFDARMSIPRLTTVRQPFRQLGERTVARLLEEIEAENSPLPDGAEEASPRKPFIERLPVELIVRDSTDTVT